MPSPFTKARLCPQNQTKLEGHGRESTWLRGERDCFDVWSPLAPSCVVEKGSLVSNYHGLSDGGSLSSRKSQRPLRTRGMIYGLRRWLVSASVGQSCPRNVCAPGQQLGRKQKGPGAESPPGLGTSPCGDPCDPRRRRALRGPQGCLALPI